MFTTTLSRPDLASPQFERRWRDFAAAVGASFFQDWTWLGRLAIERYPDPVLAETRRGDRLVGLALFNRRRDRPWGETLHLHESGDAAWDAVFIEHNGPLVSPTDRGAAGDLLRACLDAPLGRTRRRIVLSGVDKACCDAAHTLPARVQTGSVRPAPYVDFAAMPPDCAYLDTLSRNTRHQLRRSNRLYAGADGLTLRRAETLQAGRDYFAAMVRLHEATWTARGKPGAFAAPEVRRFHDALLEAGIPRGEVDLLECAAGSTIVGYLMNFRHRGIVSAYQSGFAYRDDAAHFKPGLTCHALAIEAARRDGAQVYDFLAGAGRYKSSLANAERPLYWLEAASPGHPAGMRARLRRLLGRAIRGGA